MKLIAIGVVKSEQTADSVFLLDNTPNYLVGCVMHKRFTYLLELQIEVN